MNTEDLPPIQIIDIGPNSGGLWDAKLQLKLVEHIERFRTNSKGKSEAYDQLATKLAHNVSGLGWKQAWQLRLAMLGHKCRLPRRFKEPRWGVDFAGQPRN